MITFADACSRVEAVLADRARPEMVTDVSRSKEFAQALVRLRERMRSHQWKAGAHSIDLQAVIKTYDGRTRQEGFHVLHDWDGKSDKVNEDIIPVEVLNFVLKERGGGQPDHRVLAILLDYYFLYVLALLSVRVWDEGHADAALDRLTELLRELQGPNGSGHQFADHAETLLLVAGSHYELEDRGYDRLLERVRTLNYPHRVHVARAHAASLGSHLRFGFVATYGRDLAALREDNVVDYPWLCFALATMMREYGRLHESAVRGLERDRVVEALLNGLSADVDAFVGDSPLASLSGCDVERSEFRALFQQYRRELLAECESHRPSDRRYSPISLFFNFSHNVLKGMAVDALLWGEPWHLTLDDLLTGLPHGDAKGAAKATVARALMGYARANPDRIRGRLMPVIVYDPVAGRQCFATTLRAMKD